MDNWSRSIEGGGFLMEGEDDGIDTKEIPEKFGDCILGG